MDAQFTKTFTVTLTEAEVIGVLDDWDKIPTPLPQLDKLAGVLNGALDQSRA